MSASNTPRRDRTSETAETAETAADKTGDTPVAEPTGAESEAEAPAAPENEAAADEAGRVRELEREAAELRDQVLRARAEVENVLRRTQREKQDISAYAISDFARSLLVVADNLRRALEAVPEEARGEQHMKALIEGVEMTERELLSALEKQGIRKIEPRGERFDHNYHQAMAQVDAPDQAPGTVVDVFQPGYVIKDRLLRPAMVTVAKKQAEAGGDGDNVDTTA